jgi:micrococcal nuclease
MSSSNYKYKAKCIRVIDGDTIIAEVDLGFNIYTKVSVRLEGIDAPEVRTRDLEEKKRGLASKEYLEDIFSLDKSFILDSKKIDKYGRCLGTIYLGDTNINEEMIEEGFAVVYE